MHDVNWWLMALSFVLGLVLMLAMMIRRVEREVPVSKTFAASAGAPSVSAPEVGNRASAKSGTGAVAAGGAAATLGGGKRVEPYGPGSVRGRGAGP